jgi:hypothetical protein
MNERRLAALLTAIVSAASGCDDCDSSKVESRSSVEINVGPDGKVLTGFEDAGMSDAGPSTGGVVTVTNCKSACEQTIFERCGHTEVEDCSVTKATSAAATVRCDFAHYPACLPPGTQCGRRPQGAVFARAEGGPLATLFGGMAALEAASVPAFRRLSRELSDLGAPRRLVRAARRSARDEVAHARTTKHLARRFGSKAASFVVPARSERSIVELALENAVEGCVRETFGALVATYQASHARDAEIRCAMQRIARDETRHAALAQSVDRFLQRRLTVSERSAIRAAKRTALAQLAREVATPADGEIIDRAGIPSPPTARRLLEGLTALLS